jgi:hypothetical protein
MPARKVSPLKKERQAEKSLQNYDELNTIIVPVTPLRFELAQCTKNNINELPLGDLLLMIHALIKNDT